MDRILTTTPEGRELRGWNDLDSFVRALVSEKTSDEKAKSEESTVSDEERALYPDKEPEEKPKNKKETSKGPEPD